MDIRLTFCGASDFSADGAKLIPAKPQRSREMLTPDEKRRIEIMKTLQG